MSHPLHHAISSQKKHGGKVEDYIEIHNFKNNEQRIYTLRTSISFKRIRI